jgi:hypothetical protein
MRNGDWGLRNGECGMRNGEWGLGNGDWGLRRTGGGPRSGWSLTVPRRGGENTDGQDLRIRVRVWMPEECVSWKQSDVRGSGSFVSSAHVCYNDGSLGGLCEREAMAKAVGV